MNQKQRVSAGTSEKGSPQAKQRKKTPGAAKTASGELAFLPVAATAEPQPAAPESPVAVEPAPPLPAPPGPYQTAYAPARPVRVAAPPIALSAAIDHASAIAPVAEATALAPAVVTVRPIGRASPAPAILVATADPAISRMLAFGLDQLRLPYRVMNSGTVVLNELLTTKVGRQRPVVVLDVDLPGVDGHAILERLGVKRPDTFLILVLSSHADESVQVRSLLAGAVDHLAKPFNVRVLMAKIQRWTSLAAHLAGTG